MRLIEKYRSEKKAWQAATDDAIKLAEQANPVAICLKSTPSDQDIYYNPETKLIKFSRHNKTLAVTIKELGLDIADNDDGIWLRVKQAAPLGIIGHLGGWRPNFVTNALGGPSTLTAALGSGALGAGLGYGAGMLHEQFMHEDDPRRGKQRKLLGVLGTLAGAAPALFAGYHGWFKDIPPGAPPANVAPGTGAQPTAPKPELNLPSPVYNTAKEALDCASKMYGTDSSPFEKSISLSEYSPTISAFLMESRLDSAQLPLPIKSAACGLLKVAQYCTGSDCVSPHIIGTISSSMGSKYSDGLLAGKILSALSGLDTQATHELQKLGSWQTIINRIIPLSFPCSQS